MVTSVKQAACRKRSVFQFPAVTYKYKFTCIKQAPDVN